MVETDTFAPDWISPPGATIATILDERGIHHGEFARQLKTTAHEVELLLDGRAVLTQKLAQQLAIVLGPSESFWLSRESQYRKAVARLQQRSSQRETIDWLKEIPIKDMVERGWLQPNHDLTAMAAACLQFFGVSSVEAWRRSYKDVLEAVAFRTSKTFASQPAAVAAWLRQGEIAAGSIKCGVWDRDRFQRDLAGIRDLTREKVPESFLPVLIERCAACGVAVVILRAPIGCKASGASRFLSPTRPLLVFSFRHLSDDQFWFTFFHESGHLVLHSDKIIFLEGDDRLSNAEEDEADAFAAQSLIPSQYQHEMFRLPAHGREVMRFARRIGVSPGIVVGQLQHYGKIRRNQLNNLKRRYTWREE